MRRRDLVMGLSAPLCVIGLALAGPEWEEPTNGDAGNSLQTASSVSAPNGGYVGVIKGKLDGQQGSGFLEGDYQDMFQINIVDPGYFIAETVFLDGGLFDPILFLFNRDGKGIAASNDLNDGVRQSKLDVNDPSTPLFLEAGIYYLAITSAMSEALGGIGDDYGPMFQMGFSEHQVGQILPNGQFAGSPLVGWSDGNPENIGHYEIMLHGVGSIPAPGAMALLACAVMGARRRRR